jgi:hypothetical protein
MNAQLGMNWLRDKLNHPAHRGTLLPWLIISHSQYGGISSTTREKIPASD